MGNVQFNDSKVLFTYGDKVAMEAACCCCECLWCIGGTTPAALEVVIEGMAEGGTGCPSGECVDLDGTYILTKDWDSDNCCYYCYEFEGSCTINGIRAFINLDVIEVDLTSLTTPGVCGSGVSSHVWKKTFAEELSDCVDELTPPADLSHDADAAYCDGSGATCTVKAL